MLLTLGTGMTIVRGGGLASFGSESSACARGRPTAIEDVEVEVTGLSLKTEAMRRAEIGSQKCK